MKNPPKYNVYVPQTVNNQIMSLQNRNLIRVQRDSPIPYDNCKLFYNKYINYRSYGVLKTRYMYLRIYQHDKLDY